MTVAVPAHTPPAHVHRRCSGASRRPSRPETYVGALCLATVAVIPALADGWPLAAVGGAGLVGALLGACGVRLFMSDQRSFSTTVADERGVTIFDVLIASMVVSVLIVGVAYAYGSQHASTAREANADALRDVGSAIDVDATAIAAYDANAAAALSALAAQSSTLTINGQTATIRVSGGTGGLALTLSTPDGSQANLVAPIPIAQPTPQ